jgi:hypothetical protein
MARLLAVLVAAVVVLAWAPAARAACSESPRGVSADVRGGGSEALVTRASVCRGGRAVVVARGVLRGRGSGRRGTYVADAARAGGRVAVLVARVGPSGTTAEMIVFRVQDGRAVRRRRVLTARNPVALTALQVGITSHGDLGWTVPRGGGSYAAELVVQRIGAQPAVAGRLDLTDLDDLGVDDDATFVVASSPPVFFDVRPPQMVAGCPVRRRFPVVAQSPDLVVTAGQVNGGTETSLVRVCLRGSGRDEAIAAATATVGNGHVVTARGARGTTVLVERRETSRYPDGCIRPIVSAIDVTSGRRRSIGAGGCDAVGFADSSPSGSPIVLAPDYEGVPLLLTTTQDGEPLELDRGPITNVAVVDSRVTWRHDGQPRSAEVP